MLDAGFAYSHFLAADASFADCVFTVVIVAVFNVLPQMVALRALVARSGGGVHF